MDQAWPVEPSEREPIGSSGRLLAVREQRPHLPVARTGDNDAEAGSALIAHNGRTTNPLTRIDEQGTAVALDEVRFIELRENAFEPTTERSEVVTCVPPCLGLICD